VVRHSRKEKGCATAVSAVVAGPRLIQPWHTSTQLWPSTRPTGIPLGLLPPRVRSKEGLRAPILPRSRALIAFGLASNSIPNDSGGFQVRGHTNGSRIPDPVDVSPNLRTTRAGSSPFAKKSGRTPLPPGRERAPCGSRSGVVWQGPSIDLSVTARPNRAPFSELPGQRGASGGPPLIGRAAHAAQRSKRPCPPLTPLRARLGKTIAADH
jgi:hypothetical protein